MFDDKQVAALNAKLDGDAVKHRQQGGTSVSYIEGYAAINNANRIFGFGNWQGRIVSMVRVDDREVERNGKKGVYLGYTCEYEVTVFDKDRKHSVTFSDIGYGSSTSYQGLGDAVESATKEAATDAMKRTLRNFGNQFGLALYDKDQRNVDRGDFDIDAARKKIATLPQVTVADLREALDLFTRDELVNLYKAISQRPATVPAE